MNASLYLFSVVLTAGFIGISAWSRPDVLRLPALTRLVTGLAAAPFVLAAVTLSVALLWPGAPRVVLLAAPGLLVLGLALLQPVRVRLVLCSLLRRWPRWRPGGSGAPLLLLIAFWSIVAVRLAANARAPIAAHDALIYLNEARVFATDPSWGVYLAMVNPAAPDALVAGHTHTWLYPTYLAQALLAGAGSALGAGNDLVARFAIQGNLLLLLMALMGLVWAVTRRNTVLTLGAGILALCIPFVEYITLSASIDAFRVLPLVLLTTVLAGGLRKAESWALAAMLAGTAAAAHTLNLLFVPVLIAARLMAGLKRTQWRCFWRRFLPAATLALLPVGAFYGYVWLKTGRLLGHGLHYPFYAGSALEEVARRGILESAKPTFQEVWTTLQSNYGWWVPGGFWLGFVAHLMIAPSLLRRFLAGVFVGCWLLLVSGAVPEVPPVMTRVLLGNARYVLVVWFLAIPLVAAALDTLSSRVRIPRLVTQSALALATGALLVGAGWWRLHAKWTISPQAITEELRTGEWRVAAEAKQALGPGETWMTDRNTAAYFVGRSGIFLYTPAGRQWIVASSEAEAWSLLCRHRVRLVALNNLNPSWWPSTALHAALDNPAHADKTALPRWHIYHLKIPPAGGASVPPDTP